MERVIVTVKRKGESRVCDLEVPVEMASDALVQEIALALGWGGGYEIYAVPPERVLHPHETLAQAGVWDGAWLVFQPAGSGPVPVLTASIPTSPPTSAPPPAREEPVIGWHKLDVTPPSPSTQETPPSSSDGFTWKRIDED